MTTSILFSPVRPGLLLPALTLGICSAISLPLEAQGQITPDNTLGDETSVVTEDALVQGDVADLIEGGALRGSNLFHSFQNFNVGEGQRVYFANPLGIEHILSRITGSDPSNIMGTLGVDGPADLFLLNPNGIVFGPEATLDVAGSFYATTAAAIPLGDSIFSATDPEQSTLLTVNPSVLFTNYLTEAAGDITSRGQLAAPANLTLAANNLDLQGQVAAGGELTLLGLDTVQIRDTVEVPFIGLAGGDLLVQGNEQVDIVALSHPDSGLYSYGNMVLRSANPVAGDAHYWSAGDFRVETLDGEVGDLFSPVDPIIRAFGDVEIAGYGGSSLHILAGGAVTIGIAVIAAPDPGVIGIDFLQETIELSDGTLVEVDGSIQPTLDVRAGVSPEALVPSPLENPSGLDPFDSFLDTQFQISAPNILDTPSSADITVSNILIPNERGLVLLTNLYKPNLALVGGDISIPNLGSLDFGIEAAGSNAYIDSRRDVDISNSGVDTSDAAEGGSIYIAGRNLLAESSRLDASNDEVGNAGNIAIDFLEDIDYQGRITSDSGDDGAGGNISLSANNIYFSGSLTAFSKADDINRNSININAKNNLDLQINPSILFVPPLDAVSGDFEISGNDVSISGSNLFFTSGIPLDAGDIRINARQNLQIIDSFITTLAFISDGNTAGDIILSGTNIDLFNTSFSAETGTGENFPGLISFDAENRLSIDGGFITVITGSGFGGNILLSADLFEANDTLIDARVVGVDGGEIFLDVSGLAEISSSEITASTIRESGKAGTVRVNAENLILSDGSDLNSSSSLGLFGLSFGDAGEVILDVDNELIMSNSSISSFSETSGDAGSVTVDVGNSFLLENSRASSFTTSSGNAGVVRVNAENLTLNNNSELNSSSLAGAFDSSSGDAGEVILDIDNELIMSNSSISSFSETSGDAGSVTVDVRNNFLLENSRASSFTTSSGNAGFVRVNAENLTLNNSELNSSSLAGAFDSSSGDAGEVILDVDNELIMSNSSISSFSETSGDAGGITTNIGNNFFMTNASIGSFGAASGDAGSIRLDVANQLSLNDSTISVSSGDAGLAGDIFLGQDSGTVRVVLNDGSQIIAESATVDGGNITLNLTDLLLLRNGSLISASAGTEQAGGNGGNITISVPFIIAIPEENSDIAADAFEGTGGNVTINARGVFGIEPRAQRTPLSDITASSELGVTGTVNFEVLDTGFIENSLTNLDETPVDTATLTAGSCIARADDTESSFVVTGADGLPQRPGNEGVATFPTGAVRGSDTPVAAPAQDAFAQPGRSLQEPTGVYELNDGRLVLSHECS